MLVRVRMTLSKMIVRQAKLKLTVRMVMSHLPSLRDRKASHKTQRRAALLAAIVGLRI